jgi:mono/diheme cytochrome c family protein
MRSIIAIGTVVVVGGLAYAFWPASEQSVQAPSELAAANTALVDVLLPDGMSQNAQIGQLAYESNCVACHGTNAAGQDGVAPPLIHIIYEPNNHVDARFQRAAALGVQSHHWPFGDMPAAQGVTRDEVTMIIAFVRELQRANGIN